MAGTAKKNSPLRKKGIFKKLEKQLTKKGVKNPAALTAWIVRKGVGKKALAKASAAGRRAAKRKKK